ncbi:malignant T-cell-amplified sequence 1 isoform X5 [Oryctolagus cuniculus]
MPKKDPVKIVRCHEHIEILTVNGELLFFRQREGPFYPTLRLLHKYPFILPHQQVDKGAIKFVLSGANIMCPGLTSPGAKLYPAAVDTIVAIMAEGKQHALCVGVMKMSAEDIETQRERMLPSSGSLPNCPQRPGLGQVKARKRNSIQVCHMGGQGPNYLSHHLLPPRICISRMLESVAGIQTQAFWYGMWASQPAS